MPASKVNLHDNIQSAFEVLKRSGRNFLPVLDSDRLVGVLCAQDLPQRIESHLSIKQIMRAPVRSIEASCELVDALKLMVNEGLEALLVTDKNQVLGMVSGADFLKLLGLMVSSSEVQFGQKLEFVKKENAVGLLALAASQSIN